MELALPTIIMVEGEREREREGKYIKEENERVLASIKSIFLLFIYIIVDIDETLLHIVLLHKTL